MTVNSEFQDSRGLHYFGSDVDPGFLLLSAYFPEEGRSGIKLVRLSDAQIIKSWYPDPEQIRDLSDYDDFQTEDRFEPQSPLLMPDGGLIFIDNQGPLVRIDACSEIEWILDGRFHHSIEYGLDKTLFVPFVIRDSQMPWPIRFQEDAVAQVSLDGRILGITSVAEILLRDGYRGLLFGVTPLDWDPIHLNDVEIAQRTTRNWKRGDWLLSLRSRSAIVLYRPGTRRVVWLKLGPWALQHDPNFLDDGRISIFGNDVLEIPGGGLRFLDGFSNVYLYDPETALIDTPYQAVFEKWKISTPTQGKATILDDGDVFVEETDRGRLVRASPDRLEWSYYNTYRGEAGVLHWSRYMSAKDVSRVKFAKDCL